MKILKQIKADLKQNIDLNYKKGCTNFFNEPIKLYGVRTPIVRKIGNKYYSEIKKLPKKEIFELCEQLLKTNLQENATIAFSWAYKQAKNYTKKDFKTFETWLKKYVTNWAMCDDFCTHPIGKLLLENPDLMPKVKAWTNSKNRWVKRAAAVTLIHGLKKANFLSDVFEVSDKLLQDSDDLVQKGYGWALKVAADSYPSQVFKYVLKNKTKMPRTSLRYAIEKMPKEWKRQAMSK